MGLFGSLQLLSNRGAFAALLPRFLARNTTVALTFGLYGVFIRFFAESFALDRTMASAGLPIVILTMGLENPWMAWLIERFAGAAAVPLFGRVRDRPKEIPAGSTCTPSCMPGTGPVGTRELFRSPFFWPATLATGVILALGSMS